MFRGWTAQVRICIPGETEWIATLGAEARPKRQLPSHDDLTARAPNARDSLTLALATYMDEQEAGRPLDRRATLENSASPA